MPAPADVLEHYGVKGMKWGVRRTRAQLDADSVDAAVAKTLKAKVKKNRGSTDPLSNDDLRTLTTRMNLEQQFAGLRTREAQANQSAGKKFLKKVLLGVTEQQVNRIANQVVTEQVDSAMKKARK